MFKNLEMNKTLTKQDAAPPFGAKSKPRLGARIRGAVLARLTKPDEWIAEATKYADQHDMVKAIEVNANGLSCFPKNRELLIQSAELAVADRDFGRAAKLWRSVETQYPQHVFAYEVQMNLARKAKDLEEARRIIAAAESNIAEHGEKLRLLADLAGTYNAIKFKSESRSDWFDALRETLSAHMRGIAPGTKDRFLLLANPLLMSSPVRIRLAKDLISLGFYASAGELIQKLQALADPDFKEQPLLDDLSARLEAEKTATPANGRGRILMRGLEDLSDGGIGEALLSRVDGADSLTISFHPDVLNPEIGAAVLGRYVQGHNSHHLCLTDKNERAFFFGISSFGGDREGTVHRIRKLVAELGNPRVLVVGKSFSGFVALDMAIGLGADAFLGTGIRTNLSQTRPSADQAGLRLRRAEVEHPDLLIDLKPKLSQSQYPRVMHLYFGENNEMIRAHAEHLADLTRANLHPIRGYGGKKTFAAMLTRGMLPAAIEQLYEAPTTPQPKAKTK